MINTVINDRMDLHLARLHETVTWSRTAAWRPGAMQGAMSRLGSDAELAGLKQLAGMVRRRRR